jgi:hypothetical protein
MPLNAAALAVIWLAAYKGKSFDIVDMYARDAVVECAGGLTLIGRLALEALFVQRFEKRAALRLVKLVIKGGDVVSIHYLTSHGTSEATIGFDRTSGMITWQRCEELPA